MRSSTLFLVAPSAAALSLHSFLGSHMVLAREPLSARVWGNSTSGETVTVTLAGVGSFHSEPAAGNGSWFVDLPPQPAGINHKLTFSDSTTTTTLNDVAFGDVYLCTGQSNMEFSLNAAMNASAEIAGSIHYPNIRLATVANQFSDTPMANALPITNYTEGGKIVAWRRSEPDAFAPANTTDFSYFSAVCYLFGRDLHRQMHGVPIGLVASDVGGVKIETMMSVDARLDQTCGGTTYRYVPRSNGTMTRVDQVGGDGSMRRGSISDHGIDGANDAEEELKHSLSRDMSVGLSVSPGQMWNGMIHPLLNMRFLGVAFYQGESNSLAGCPQAYSCQFPALIADWRQKFRSPDLGFYFVQLAGYGFHDYTHLRAAQLAALQLPAVGMATAIDLGDMASPHGGIHPRLKQEVGRRLALTARAVQFLEPVSYEGPKLLGVQLLDRQGTSAVLTFAPSSAMNLHLDGTAGCQDCCATPPTKPWFAAFELQAPNSTWLPAMNATVHRNTVLVRSAVSISGVRAGWNGMPDCLLYNGHGGALDHAGLPAPPFRHCLFGDDGLGAWNWLSDCNPTAVTDVQPPASGEAASTLASSDMSSLLLGQTRIIRVAPDASTSGNALQTGKPQKGASWFSRQAIACANGDWIVDSLELRLRYRATPPNVSAADAPATLTLTLFNGDVKRVATVGKPIPLGNYSKETGFSQPLHVRATALKAACDAGLGSNAHGRLRLQMAIVNNDRPVTIPLDDLDGGFRIKVGWVRAGA